MNINNADTESFEEKLIRYCKNNSKIQLTEITDFEWDKAYLDYDSYQGGEAIKEKHGITGSLQKIRSDYLFRIAFSKDGKITEDIILNMFYIEFDESIEVITPKTLFTVNWVQLDDDNQMLSLVENK